jgi:hypothetical protein
MLVFALGFPQSPSTARGRGCAALYLGGTLDSLAAESAGAILTDDPISFVFITKRAAVRVPYERVNLLEYGLQVDRRLAEAILLSPLFLLSDKKKHFLTVGYENEEGKQQALVFEVDKSAVRTVLAVLEARTGRTVRYGDGEARKAGGR